MNNFNLIWFAHHLVFVGMALLIFHPMPHIPDEANEWGYSDAWVWIGIFVLKFEVLQHCAARLCWSVKVAVHPLGDNAV